MYVFNQGALRASFKNVLDQRRRGFTCEAVGKPLHFLQADSINQTGIFEPRGIIMRHVMQPQAVKTPKPCFSYAQR